MSTMSDELRNTILCYPRGVEILADLMGVTPDYLYRSYLEGESGRTFDIRNLPALLEHTGDLRILNHLSAIFNRVPVEFPDSKPSEPDFTRITNKIQKQSADTVSSLLLYIEHPDPPNRKILQRRITALFSTLSSLRLLLNYSNQETLPL